MVEPRGHADFGDSPDDIVGTPRRVGQQDDSLPITDQRAQAIDGSRDRGDPVMDHAPKVENEAVVARRQLAQPGNQVNWHAFHNLEDDDYRPSMAQSVTSI